MMKRIYQFMHSKDLWPTKFINFSHAGAIIFQGRNNCTSNINNIYRLDSANKHYQENDHNKFKNYIQLPQIIMQVFKI